jgi:hypothetical protein
MTLMVENQNSISPYMREGNQLIAMAAASWKNINVEILKAIRYLTNTLVQIYALNNALAKTFGTRPEITSYSAIWPLWAQNRITVAAAVISTAKRELTNYLRHLTRTANRLRRVMLQLYWNF